MNTERPEVRYREWESSDGAGTVFDLDEVYEAFRYAQDNGLSVSELFGLFAFPDQRFYGDTAMYELPPAPREPQ